MKVIFVTLLLLLNSTFFLVVKGDKSDSIGKMGSDRRKNHYCGQKKPESTSCAMFNVGTAARCCEIKRYVLRLD